MVGTPLVINYDEYRADKSQKGKEYEDFVCEYLAKQIGLVITVFSSKKYQYNKGETLQGVEIKYDMRYGETGNLYIEVGEKAKPRNGCYFPSGILREDNTWLYIIGNYKEIFVFGKKHLKAVYESKRYYRLIENNGTETSTGFLLTKEQANRYCMAKYNIENTN